MSTEFHDTILADTNYSRAIHYRLRYQMYCLEKGYEDPEEYPNKLEKDIYDVKAVPFLVHHPTKNEWVGTCRIIMDKPSGLPFFAHAKFDPGLAPPDENSIVAELSRLIILREHQRRSDKESIVASKDEPGLLARLIYSSLNYAWQQGARQLYFISLRSMQRVFQSVGIAANPLGPPTVYRGMRYPFVVDLERLFGFDDGQTRPELVEKAKSFVCYSRLSMTDNIAA